MFGDSNTIGTLRLQVEIERTFESYTVSKKKSIGKIIPFHVTDEKVDLLIGYAIFLNGERDIRTMEVLKEHDTFSRLKHGLRLTVLPIPNRIDNYFVELKQAIPRDSFAKHETLHPTRYEADLDAGAKLSVFSVLRKLGAKCGTKREVLADASKTSENLCASFSKENIWVPVGAYVLTRILPIRWGYRG